MDRNLRGEVGWSLEVVLGSKVERVNRRRVTKTKRAQMEIVDWALERMTLEALLLLKLGFGGDEEEEEEDDGTEGDDGEEIKSLFLSTMGLLSSGKKTRRRPMPQFSLLLPLLLLLDLAFAEMPILLTPAHSFAFLVA